MKKQFRKFQWLPTKDNDTLPLRETLIILAIAALIMTICLTSCSKLTTENIQAHNEGNILFRWELISYTGPDHVKLSVENYPCLKDDQIIFYPNRTGKISQGNCIFFSGKARDVAFNWHFTAVSTADLESNGGHNSAFIDGEGEVLTIFESEPYFREYKYRKIPD